MIGLALPSRESIHRFEEAYDHLGTQFQRLEEKKQEIIDAIQDTLQHLDEIDRIGTVPTELDLMNARGQRDEIWRLLRRHWVDGEDVTVEASDYQDEGTLPDVLKSG